MRRTEVLRAAARLEREAENRAAAAPAMAAPGQTARVRNAIRAFIPRSNPGAPGKAAQQDGPREESHSHAGPVQATPFPAGPVEEPQDGGVVSLPDIRPFDGSVADQEDPILSAIFYRGTVAQGGATPSGFGVTRPYTHALSGITITSNPWGYFVRADLDNPITWQVRGSTGPNSQVNILSPTDAAITATNYTDVISDLTPDMSDLNGRPPRDDFWARDLTILHERFHAYEDKKFAALGTIDAMNWLSARTASSVASVRALLNRVPGKVAQKVRTEMAFPGREERAYGSGAPIYTLRAEAIRIRGDAGLY